MRKISAVIITFNEEKNIGRCLSSLNFVDEIVVYDGNSTDNTKSIAESFGSRVIMRQKWNGFGIAKQEAVALATNDYIFSIDVDEVVTPELAAEICDIANSDDDVFSFRIKRRSFFAGKEIKHSGWKNNAPLRLFDRRKANFTTAPVHEKVVPDAGAKVLKEYLLHYSYPDIKTYTHRMLGYAEVAADEKRAKGKTSSLSKAIFAGAFKFIKMYILKLGILDGRSGLILSLNSAYGEFYRYLLLL